MGESIVLKNARRLGIDLISKRVLDFGCGKGGTVSALLADGVDAYGVDNAPGEIALAQELVGDRCVLAENSFPWPDGYFDYIVANQVLEHVTDLTGAMAEVARVLKPGGHFYSNSPARWMPVEPRIFIPFVHWMKPGPLRRAYIGLCIRLGIGQTNGATANAQEHYLRTETFYRTRREMRRILGCYFHVEFVASRQLAVVLRERGTPLPRPLLPLAEWAVGEFHEHRILAWRRS